MKRNWQTRALLASVIAISSTPLASNLDGAAAPGGPSAAAPEAAETLANLGDKRLMSELADRGLDSLLDRYFELHQTPEAQQKAIRSTEGLRDLNNPKAGNNAEKEKKVKQIVAGITTTLPSINDPYALQKDAGLLLIYGVTRGANLLEYWGENPATAAQLRPTAQAVYDMLGKAAKVASEQAGRLAGQINNNNQNTVGAEWDKLSNLANNAAYTQAIMAYDLAMTLPRPERDKLVDTTLKYLDELDNADSTVMPLVHLTMGKLNMVAGRTDDALKYLEAVSNSDPSIKPPPEPANVYEAKYFSNVTLMQAGKIDEARKGLESLITWEKTAFTDPEAQKKVTGAAEMLRYRIFLAEAAAAKDPTAKKAAEDNAVAVLMKLSEARPDLRGTIYQQLVERLPKDAPVTGLDPLLLRGLMAKAYDEANKPSAAGMDQSVIQRGLAAAQEVARRPTGPVLTPQMKDEAVRLTPVLLEAGGKKVEAAQEFLNYARDNANTHRQLAEGALDDAGRLAFDLRRTDPQDAQVSALFDAFLPVAINAPFNHVNDLAYLYGSRLAATGKPQEAIKYLHMVPKSDKTYNSAQYAMLKANQDLINTPKLPPEQRMALANDLVRQAESVRQIYASQADPKLRRRAVVATLIEAETLGGDLKQPAEALRLLTGFEDTAKGIADEKVLANAAMLDRVNAYVALNQLQQATNALVSLLKETGGEQGATFVHGLLDRLDKDLEKAQSAHDTNAAAAIAKSEADLSGFLVNWARANSNPDIRKFTYQYMVFDARTQRLAGTLATDPAQKTALLEKAMAAYKRLQQQDTVALYKATLDPAKVAASQINPDDPDPKVQLGIGLTDYELKDYKGAADILGNLLNTGKLGGATVLITDAHGDEKVVDNDTYWEASYDLYASNIGAAKGPDDPVLAPTKQGLKNLLIRGGIPAKWQDPFESMRKELVPDFNVAALADAPTTQPAATQPVSTR